MTAAPLLFIALLLSLSSAGAVDFAKDIKPILKSHCYECHSESAGKEKAGYVFDNLERFKSDIGPKGQIVPGDAARSNFLELLTRDKDPMPPSGKARLSPKEIKLIREWIEAGALLESGGKSPSGKEAGSKLAPRKAVPSAAPLLDWTSTDGKIIKAGFVRLNTDSVVIKTDAGKMFKVPLARLSPESQEQAKKSAMEAEKAK